jgi:uncharacterized protein
MTGPLPTVPPAGAEPERGAAPAIDRRMLEALICPRSQATLRYDAARQELISEASNLAYPIRDGIPIMLVSEARVLE